MRISDWSSDVCSSDLEHMTQKMLARVFPNRNVNDIPKFPAHYSGCRISRHVRVTLSDIGFSDVWQIPFYGHTYYGKFPVIREVHAEVSKAIAAMEPKERETCRARGCQ